MVSYPFGSPDMYRHAVHGKRSSDVLSHDLVAGSLETDFLQRPPLRYSNSVHYFAQPFIRPYPYLHQWPLFISTNISILRKQPQNVNFIYCLLRIPSCQTISLVPEAVAIFSLFLFLHISLFCRRRMSLWRFNIDELPMYL